ncbi:MAG: DUF975 family protein [Lachnospiraceae bacterium]|nr:DUF975 family protein [Lachnospiraceae bacterium]
MWKISALKGRAKVAFKANYWKCVVAALIIAALVGGPAANGAKNGVDTYNQMQQEFNQNGVYYEYDLEDEDSNPLAGFLNSNSAGQSSGVNVQFGARTGLLGTVLQYLVFNPLIIGVCAFFFVNSYKKAELDEIKKGFQPSWGRNVLAMFLRGLFNGLWFLLFLIPGFIKAYSYRMVPYILADDPDIDAIDAITKSRQMMDGNKWKAFVMDLSFLGWHILGILTLGILEIFYVAPYHEQAKAELYRVLRAEQKSQDEVYEA